MAALDSSTPFSPGAEILLLLDDDRHITSTITKPFKPFVKGVALLVHSDSFPPSTVILKLFDPRYRDERFYKLYCKSDRVWTLEAESAAVVDPEPLKRDEFGRPDELYEWSSDSDADEENEKSSMRKKPPEQKDEERKARRWEKYLQEQSQASFETEVGAYKRLKEL